MLFRKRSAKGSILAEFAPALLVLLLAMFFPMVDLVTIGASFGCTWYLNHLVTKELAVNSESSRDAIIAEVNNDFLNTGLAKYIGVDDQSDITHNVSYIASTGSEPPSLSCETVLSTRPLVLVQFIQNVAGVSLPVVFRVTTLQVRENVNN